MCTVSNIGDQWRGTFPQRWPNIVPNTGGIQWPPQVTREEIEALKREMQELRELLLAAKKYDAATGQPDCEMGEKVLLIKQIAKLVGVDVSDVFKE